MQNEVSTKKTVVLLIPICVVGDVAAYKIALLMAFPVDCTYIRPDMELFSHSHVSQASLRIPVEHI